MGSPLPLPHRVPRTRRRLPNSPSHMGARLTLLGLPLPSLPPSRPSCTACEFTPLFRRHRREARLCSSPSSGSPAEPSERYRRRILAFRHAADFTMLAHSYPALDIPLALLA